MWNWAVEKGYSPPWLWKVAPLCVLLVVLFSFPSLLGQGYRPFMTVASVQGVLKQFEIVKCNYYKGESTWTPVVSYEYTVQAGMYKGTRFSIERVCASREEVERATGHLVPGQPVTVFYNESKPGFALLKKPGSLLWMYFYQSMLGLGAIVILWNNVRLTRERAV